MSAPDTCDDCGGTGTDEWGQRCWTCKGRGFTEGIPQSGTIVQDWPDSPPGAPRG